MHCLILLSNTFSKIYQFLWLGQGDHKISKFSPSVMFRLSHVIIQGHVIDLKTIFLDSKWLPESDGIVKKSNFGQIGRFWRIVGLKIFKLQNSFFR